MLICSAVPLTQFKTYNFNSKRY
uniref:Uncharacterized protein n=1 Tax=Anguilla anguilla TaxID=7936 RepID=A0A0E9VGI1_ANGAN